MFKFFFFIVFFVVLLLLLAGFSVIRTIKTFLFGDNSQHQQKRKPSSKQQSRQVYEEPVRKKVIGEDEGEYVDYEEVKD